MPTYVWVAMGAVGVRSYPALAWAAIGLLTLLIPSCGSDPAQQTGGCPDIPSFILLPPLLSVVMIAGDALLSQARPWPGMAVLGLGTALLWAMIGGGILIAGAYFYYFYVLFGISAICAT